MKTAGVVRGVGVVIVVEVDPDPRRAAGFDPAGPDLKLRVRIVVPVPSLGAVQPHVDIIRGADELVRQPRAAAGTKDRAGLP